MKSTTIMGATIAAISKHFLFPDGLLLSIMGVVIILDFITGILKSTLLKVPITSRGFSRTIIKFLQYGGGILVGIIMSGIAKQKDWAELQNITNWLVDGLVVFIVYIEVVSILENLYAVDKKSLMSKYIFIPLYKLLTFQLKNNPLVKASEQTNNENSN